MHVISKLALWLTAVSLLLRGFAFGGAGIAFYLIKKGVPIPNELIPFNEDELFNGCCVQLMFMVICMICGAYILHGKPSRDAKYAPMVTLCIAVITLLLIKVT